MLGFFLKVLDYTESQKAEYLRKDTCTLRAFYKKELIL